jgi:hypothetical protein
MLRHMQPSQLLCATQAWGGGAQATGGGGLTAPAAAVNGVQS